jgi:hypothetical protein
MNGASTTEAGNGVVVNDGEGEPIHISGRFSSAFGVASEAKSAIWQAMTKGMFPPLQSSL